MDKLALTKEFALANFFTKTGQLSSKQIRIFGFSHKEVYDAIYGERQCAGDNCNNITNFQVFTRGYTMFCCKKCFNESSLMQEKKEASALLKYGVKHTSQAPAVKEKSEATAMAKYGVKHHFQSTGVKKKIATTMLSKYGAKHPMQSIAIQEKQKATVFLKFGVDNVLKSPVVRQQIKGTVFKNFGTEHPMQSPLVKAKQAATVMLSYGVKSTLLVPFVRKKIELTNLTKYGFKNAAKSEIVKAKTRTTVIEKYGVPYVLQSPEIKAKVRDTILTLYGAPNVLLNPFIRKKADVAKRIRMESDGRWLPISEQSDFIRYRSLVYSHTYKAAKHDLFGIEKRGLGFHLDHMFSVKQGFEEKIPPYIIGNICNFQMLPSFDNTAKGAKCSISKEDLFERFARSQ